MHRLSFSEGGLKRADGNLTEFQLDVLTDLVNDTGLGKEIRKLKAKERSQSISESSTRSCSRSDPRV